LREKKNPYPCGSEAYQIYEYRKLQGTAIRRNMKHNIIIIAVAVFIACLIVGAVLG
jgi:hypothetical protein